MPANRLFPKPIPRPHTFRTFSLGRRKPSGAPHLHLTKYLTGNVPTAPLVADHFAKVPAWILGENDQFGCCGPVSIANQRLLITTYLSGAPQTVTQDDIFDLYRRSGNPHFDPKTGADDNGVVLQNLLDELVANGIAGVKALGFASVPVSDLNKMRDAVAIFGSIILGVNLEVAQQEQTTLWDYKASKAWGGHAVMSGRYSEGPDREGVISWAQKIDFTDQFEKHQVEEAWVVIWPEHLGSLAFLEGVDVAAFAADYTAITGKPFPMPVPPAVVPTPAPPPTPTPAPVVPLSTKLTPARTRDLLERARKVLGLVTLAPLLLRKSNDTVGEARDDHGRFADSEGGGGEGATTTTAAPVHLGDGVPASPRTNDKGQGHLNLPEVVKLADPDADLNSPENKAAEKMITDTKSRVAAEVGQRMIKDLGVEQLVRSPFAQAAYAGRDEYDEPIPLSTNDLRNAIRADSGAALASDLHASWAGDSDGIRAMALAIQRAAGEEFGLSSSVDYLASRSDNMFIMPGWEGKLARYNDNVVFDQNEPTLRSFVRAEYANTQQYFQDNGIKSLTVWRGFGTDYEHLDGKNVALANNPLSSWTMNRQTADHFAEGWSASGTYGYIASMRLPAERVFSCWRTGAGCLTETEVVALGGEQDHAIVKQVRVSKATSAEALGSDDLTLTKSNPNHDEKGRFASADSNGGGTAVAKTPVHLGAGVPATPRKTDPGQAQLHTPPAPKGYEMSQIGKIYDQVIATKARVAYDIGGHLVERLGVDTLAHSSVAQMAYGQRAAASTADSDNPARWPMSTPEELTQKITEDHGAAVASYLHSAWAAEADGGSATALAVQRAAAETWGLTEAGASLSAHSDNVVAMGPQSYPEGDMTTPTAYSDNPLYDRDKGVFQAYVQTEYEHAQSYLADQGIHSLSLYRGYQELYAGGSFMNNTPDPKAGDNAAIQLNPISSWTLDRATAINFTNRPLLESRYLASMRVPAARVFSTWQTGAGCLGESEVILLGGNKDHAIVDTVPYTAHFKAAATVTMTKGDWNPEDHPRQEGGSPEGGRFAPADSGGAPGDGTKGDGASPPKSSTPVSPLKALVPATMDEHTARPLAREGYVSNEERGAQKAQIAKDVGPILLGKMSAAALAKTDVATEAYKGGPYTRDPKQTLEAQIKSDHGAAVASYMVHLWSTTSSDHFDKALAVQRAAAEEFGLHEAGAYMAGYDRVDGLYNNNPAYDKEPEIYHAFVRSVYENTQANLQAQGISELTLTRGYSADEVLQDGPQDIKMNPLTAWAQSPDKAESYAQQRAGRWGNNGYVATARVPASQVYSTWQTGPGCMAESEAVLLGRDDDQAVIKRVATAKKAATVTMTKDNPNHDELGRFAHADSGGGAKTDFGPTPLGVGAPPDERPRNARSSDDKEYKAFFRLKDDKLAAGEAKARVAQEIGTRLVATMGIDNLARNPLVQFYYYGTDPNLYTLGRLDMSQYPLIDPAAVAERIRADGGATIADNLHRAWATQADDTNATSLAIQEAAATEFGTQQAGASLRAFAASRLSTLISNYKDFPEAFATYGDNPLYRSNADLFRGYVRAEYANTQADLQSQGIDHLTVYRGYFGDQPQVAGPQAAVQFNPISSWTVNFQTAERFASGFVHGWGQYQYVAEMRVPADRVLSTWSSGAGCRSESEILLLGGEQDHAKVITLRDGPPPPLMSLTKKAAQATLAKSNPNHDELGRFAHADSGGGGAGATPLTPAERTPTWTDPGAELPYAAGPSGETDEQFLTRADAERQVRQAWDQSIQRGLALGKLSGEEAKARGWDNISGEEVKPLPATLYHATGALDQVLVNGLKTRDETNTTGLGGGTSDTISLTTDPQLAQRIADTLVEAHQVLVGEITKDDLVARAKTAGFYDTLAGFSYGGEGLQWQLGERKVEGGQLRDQAQQVAKFGANDWQPVTDGQEPFRGNDGSPKYVYWSRPMTADESTEQHFDFYRKFLAAQEVSGGPSDPMFFSPDINHLKHLDPAQVGVVEATPIPGAQGIQMSGMKEWRTWTGDALRVKKLTKVAGGRRLTLVKGVEEEARDERGRWTATGGRGSQAAEPSVGPFQTVDAAPRRPLGAGTPVKQDSQSGHYATDPTPEALRPPILATSSHDPGVAELAAPIKARVAEEVGARLATKIGVHEMAISYPGANLTWTGTTFDERNAMSRDEFISRATQQVQALGLAQAATTLVDGFHRDWAGESEGKEPIPLGIQRAVADEFGLKTSSDYLSAHVGTLDPYGRNFYVNNPHDDPEEKPIFRGDDQPLLRGYVQAEYENTQAYLKAQGITELTLFRGYWAPQTAPEATGNDVAGVTNPISSWTTDEQTAIRFAGTWGKRDSYLVAMRVPAERVFSTWKTGSGCMNEAEVIVLGGENDRVSRHKLSLSTGAKGKSLGVTAPATLRKDNPYHLPGGSPEGGRFTSADGAGSGSGWKDSGTRPDYYPDYRQFVDKFGHEPTAEDYQRSADAVKAWNDHITEGVKLGLLGRQSAIDRGWSPSPQPGVPVKASDPPGQGRAQLLSPIRVEGNLDQAHYKVFVDDKLSDSETAQKVIEATKDRVAREIGPLLLQRMSVAEVVAGTQSEKNWAGNSSLYELHQKSEEIQRTQAYDLASHIHSNWAQDADGENRISVSLQMAAAEALRASHESYEYLASHSAVYQQYQHQTDPAEKIYPQLVKAEYENTQKYLSANNITELTLYRGFKNRKAQETGDNAAVHLNPLSSWSMDKDVALAFAGKQSTRAFVASMRVPAARVVSTWRTGFGCLTESEVILLGDVGDHATVEQVNPKKKKAAATATMTKDYNPDQERDDATGRWSKEGGGNGAGGAAGSPPQCPPSAPRGRAGGRDHTSPPRGRVARPAVYGGGQEVGCGDQRRGRLPRDAGGPGLSYPDLPPGGCRQCQL